MPAIHETSDQRSARASDRPGRRRMGATDLALIATFAGLIAVLGFAGTLYPFGSLVPITAQTLGVMLAGVVLGWKRAAAAVLVFLALVAAGLPLLAGGRGSLAAFMGPTVGYMLGWVVGAAVIGWLVQLRLPSPPVWWTVLACLVGGIGAVYLLGIPGVAWRTEVPLLTAAQASLVFLPGDLIKALFAAIVGGAVHRATPGLTAPLRSSKR